MFRVTAITLKSVSMQRAMKGSGGDALDVRSEQGGYLVVPNSESLQPQAFTIEAWFYMIPDFEQTGTIIAKTFDGFYPSFAV